MQVNTVSHYQRNLVSLSNLVTYYKCMVTHCRLPLAVIVLTAAKAFVLSTLNVVHTAAASTIHFRFLGGNML